MSSEYAGNLVFPATVTVLDDLDLKNAAAVAVALEQLADRTAYLQDIFTSGGSTFNNTTLTGTTTIDGTLQNGTLSTIAMIASGAVAFQGLALSLTATGDMSLSAGDDLTITVTDDLTISCVDLSINGGRILMDATHIELADDVTLGGGSGDTITVNANTMDLGNTDLSGGTLCSVSLAGTVVFTSAGSVEAAGVLYVSGKQRLRTLNLGNTDATIDGTSQYETILPDNPSAHTLTLSHTGAAIGQRVRINAQNVVTGTDDFTLAYGVRTWFMRNASGKTAMIEFVSDGSAWVVDLHAEGGDTLRNG